MGTQNTNKSHTLFSFASSPFFSWMRGKGPSMYHLSSPASQQVWGHRGPADRSLVIISTCTQQTLVICTCTDSKGMSLALSTYNWLIKRWWHQLGYRHVQPTNQEVVMVWVRVWLTSANKVQINAQPNPPHASDFNTHKPPHILHHSQPLESFNTHKPPHSTHHSQPLVQPVVIHSNHQIFTILQK